MANKLIENEEKNYASLKSQGLLARDVAAAVAPDVLEMTNKFRLQINNDKITDKLVEEEEKISFDIF